MNDNIEGFFVKINLRNKKKCLPGSSYKPEKALISNHLAELSKTFDLYLTKCDQLLYLGGFNAGVEDSSVNNFCSSFNLTSMINKPTCFKKPDKPSCINLILTNCSKSFQNSCDIEAGLSDFHKLMVRVNEDNLQKIATKIYYLSQLQIFQ